MSESYDKWWIVATLGVSMGTEDTGRFDDTGLQDTGIIVVPCPDRVSGTGCSGVSSDVQQGLPCTSGGRKQAEVLQNTGAVAGGGCQCSSTPVTPSWPLILPLVLWVLRRFLLLTVVTGTAHAQVNAEHVQLYDGGDYAALWEADLGAPWTVYGTASYTQAKDLVVLTPEHERAEVLLEGAATQTMALSFNLAGYTRIGFALPQLSYVYNGRAAKAPGDRRVWLSVPLTDDDAPLRGSFTLGLVFPSGPNEAYLGDPGSTKATLAMAAPVGPFEAIVNVGPTLQSATALPGMQWGSRWSYGLGMRVEPVGPSFGTVELVGEAPVKFWAASGVYRPVQALGQVGVRLGNTFRLSGGAGAGLGNGLGSPSRRVLLLLDMHKEPPEDRDGDGVYDLADLCRDDPEDEDGFRDDDGCPDPDNDGDGFLDVRDDCPRQAETLNGVADFDGCPDRRTQLVLSARAEVDAIQWDIGGRSVRSFPGEVLTLDAVDEAVLVRVSAEGHVAQEQWVSFDEGDEQAVSVVLVPIPPPVVRDAERLELSEELAFALDDARLDSGSLEVVRDVARWLEGHPEVRLLRVEGRADQLGRSRYNLELSQRRADGVAAALVGAGVAPARLQAIGSGESVTDEGPVRSVDFQILVWED